MTTTYKNHRGGVHLGDTAPHRYYYVKGEAHKTALERRTELRTLLEQKNLSVHEVVIGGNRPNLNACVPIEEVVGQYPAPPVRVCVSCPTFRQDEALAVCRQHGVVVAFGRKGDAIDKLGTNWREQWKAKVVQATFQEMMTKGVPHAD